MDQNQTVSSYTLELVKEAMLKHWDSLTTEDFNKQQLNEPGVRELKWQISFMASQIAAYIYQYYINKGLKIETILNSIIDVNSILPIQYEIIFRDFMIIMPETIETIALISKYAGKGMPMELIIPLVKKNG